MLRRREFASMCESGVGDPFINVRQQVGSSGPSAYPPVTFAHSHVRTVATRTAWSGPLVLPQGAGVSAGRWLLAAGCSCSCCPVSSLAASADARRDHGQDERIHSLCQFARSRTDRTTARGCKARATSRLRDNTLERETYSEQCPKTEKSAVPSRTVARREEGRRDSSSRHFCTWKWLPRSPSKLGRPQD